MNTSAAGKVHVGDEVTYEGKPYRVAEIVLDGLWHPYFELPEAGLIGHPLVQLPSKRFVKSASSERNPRGQQSNPPVGLGLTAQRTVEWPPVRRSGRVAILRDAGRPLRTGPACSSGRPSALALTRRLRAATAIATFRVEACHAMSRTPEWNPTPAPPGEKDDQKAPAAPPYFKWLWWLSLIAMLAWNAWMLRTIRETAPLMLSYSAFLDQVRDGAVASVTITGQDVEGTFSRAFTPPLSDSETAAEGSDPTPAATATPATGAATTYTRFKTVLPPFDDQRLLPLLEEQHVRVEVRDAGANSWLIGLLTSVVPVLLFVGLLVYFGRQTQRGQQSLFGFGGSKARVYNEQRPEVTFAEVAGEDEAKHELQEIVSFLKTPDRYRALGARLPRGVLLVGTPGTGKTLMARAVAGEAGVPFYSISASEFVEMFVGVGASRVRDLFSKAKKETAADCLRRRDRRGRASARRWPGRRKRRARADPEPAPGRDGRLRREHQRDRSGGYQPARRAGPGAAAAWPLRPAGDADAAGPIGEIGGPESPLRTSAAERRRQSRRARAALAWLLGRRPGKSRQQGGPGRRLDGRIRGFGRSTSTRRWTRSYWEPARLACLAKTSGGW